MNDPMEEIEIEEQSESFVDTNSIENDFETNGEETDGRHPLFNRRKSDVWQYFKKTSKGTSTCLLCGTVRGHSNGGTSNLWTHLKLAHREKAELHNISTLTRREVRELKAAAMGSKVSNLKTHVLRQHKRKWAEHSQAYGVDKSSDENPDSSPLHATIVWDEATNNKVKLKREDISIDNHISSYSSPGRRGFCTEEESLKNFCESLFVDMKNVPRENMLKCKMEIYGVIEKYSMMTLSTSTCTMTESNEL